MKKIIFLLFSCLFLSGTYAQEPEIIRDDFNDNSLGWNIIDDVNQKTFIENGFLKIWSKHNYAVYGYTSMPIDPDFDYSIETSISARGNNNKAFYGIRWGRGGLKYSSFFLNSKGEVHLTDYDGDKSNIKFKKVLKKIVHKERPNILSVEKKGNTINYYLNGKNIYSGIHQRYDGTIISYKAPEYQNVDVDYLIVTRQKKPINLVEKPVNGYKLENLGTKINSKYSERTPIITSDGNTIFIVRDIENEDKSDIWFAEKQEAGEWGQVRNIGKPLNSKGPNGVLSVTPDGNSLLLINKYNMDGSLKGGGISLSNRINGVWQIPVDQSLHNYVNKSAYFECCLSPDRLHLIVSIANDKSYGDRDLYVSELLEDGTWSEPRNMGKTINTYASDQTPFLAADNKTLYFSSEGHPGYGSSDIFVSRRLDDTWLNWSTPENLGPEINTIGWDAYFTLSAQGDYAYMVSSDPEISMGKEDIFRIKLEKSASIDPVVLVKGKVYNRKNKEIINAQIYYEDLNTGKEVGRANSTTEDGYKIALPKGAVYGYRAEAPGFISISENLDLNVLETYTEKVVNLYLVPIEKGQTVRLNNIFFDYNKSELKPESIPELTRLVEFLQQNTQIKIQIAGHTDNMGSDDYNNKLSGDRALAVKNYITQKGIEESRISTHGYGESKPVATNETEEGRQLNRRVEFVIE
jgi:outer membrane protein OmpA-like peptidoglycan-associated protein